MVHKLLTRPAADIIAILNKGYLDTHAQVEEIVTLIEASSPNAMSKKFYRAEHRSNPSRIDWEGYGETEREAMDALIKAWNACQKMEVAGAEGMMTWEEYKTFAWGKGTADESCITVHELEFGQG